MWKQLKNIPTHDGCDGCKHDSKMENEEPCSLCRGVKGDIDMYNSCWVMDEEPRTAVNHPNHYNREGAIECIDEMVAVFGIEAVMNFCLCNVWKYRYRAADKNGAEDLDKASWYMDKYIELKGRL